MSDSLFIACSRLRFCSDESGKIQLKMYYPLSLLQLSCSAYLSCRESTSASVFMAFPKCFKMELNKWAEIRFWTEFLFLFRRAGCDTESFTTLAMRTASACFERSVRMIFYQWWWKHRVAFHLKLDSLLCVCLDCITYGWGAECLLCWVVNGTVGGVSGTISISEYHLNAVWMWRVWLPHIFLSCPWRKPAALQWFVCMLFLNCCYF